MCASLVSFKKTVSSELSLPDAVPMGKLHLVINVCFSVVTPPRNRGGVIFSLQFVCVSVCLCVYVSGILVNKIPAERMHRFGRSFR